jgi:hypothetical protein
MAHICTPSTQEAESGGLQFPVQSGLHSETLSQNTKQNKKRVHQKKKKKEGKEEMKDGGRK